MKFLQSLAAERVSARFIFHRAHEAVTRAECLKVQEEKLKDIRKDIRETEKDLKKAERAEEKINKGKGKDKHYDRLEENGDVAYLQSKLDYLRGLEEFVATTESMECLADPETAYGHYQAERMTTYSSSKTQRELATLGGAKGAKSGRVSYRNRNKIEDGDVTYTDKDRLVVSARNDNYKVKAGNKDKVTWEDGKAGTKQRLKAKENDNRTKVRYNESEYYRDEDLKYRDREKTYYKNNDKTEKFGYKGKEKIKTTAADYRG